MELITVNNTNQCSFLSSTYGWRWGAFHEVRSAFLVLRRESAVVIFAVAFEILQYHSHLRIAEVEF